MKQILVLTPVYPAQDIPKTDTPIVHYFTREWIKMGYNVHVIHYVANFPKAFYMLARPFKDIIGARVGFGIRTSPYKDTEYEIDGVKVKRICIRKIRPHALHPHKDVAIAIDKTLQYCKDQCFTPDVVVGHWPNPQLEIMHELKKMFGCKTCFVSHGDSILPLYKDRALDLLRDVDLFGFRCDKVKKRFFAEFNFDTPHFMCYSGIPETFLKDIKPKDFSIVKDFVYVGTLIKRKYPSVIPIALSKAYGKDDFCMRFIGEGSESRAIKSVAQKYKVEDHIHLMGRIERTEVLRLIDDSQVFVMISCNEAYGLVYLEAMARGCITIASRNEGFDGIIKDGENGFLCDAGNADELAIVISKIKNMPKEELLAISNNAILTAMNLTDVKAANYYINAVESI